MRIVVMLVFYLLYWGFCFLGTGTDKKNLMGLRSYPDEVQEIVRKRESNAPKKASVFEILFGNLVLFAVVFAVLCLILKKPLALADYKTAFVYFLVFGEGLGVFDLVVIDLLWWRNTKRIRFSYLPEKHCYQDPKQHVLSFVRGIPLFAAVAALAAIPAVF